MAYNYDNRRYVIISSGDASLIDFNQVFETSIDTMRFSIDGSQTFVKYDGSIPSSVESCSSKSEEYCYEDFLVALNSSSWTNLESSGA